MQQSLNLKKLFISLVILSIIFIANSIQQAHGHAITDSSDSIVQAQEVSRLEPEQQNRNQNRSHFRWLNPKTAIASETQLYIPLVIPSSPPSSQNVAAQISSSTTTNSATISTNFDQSSNSSTVTPTISGEPSQQPKSPTTTTKTIWIESFLTNAEKINSDEQRQREQILKLLTTTQHQRQQEQQDAKLQPEQNEDLVDSATISDYLSSEAPTDSGEDPLESPVTATLMVLTNNNNSAQQEFANNSRSQQHENTSTLLESNNVSAVLAISGSEEENNMIVTVPSRQILSCEQAYNRCSSRRVCAQALSLYDIECRGLISSWTDQCSARCLRAMIALWSSEEGDDLVNCDCQDNEYCLQNKNRSSICRPEVERAIEPKSVVSCSTANAICMADQLCSSAFDYYYQNCQALFSQRHCSMRCNNSLAILYRQPKASKLINCVCDGSEEFPCIKYKTYTERLCLNKYHATPPTMDFANDDFGEARETNLATDTDQTGEEDDNQVQAVYSEHDDDLAGDEYGDGTVAHAGSKDYWIPLVSGRYFTNLHQQLREQEASQQQQRLNQRQQPQKRLSNGNGSNHQQQQQQQRKTRNGARQRTRSSESAGRPNVFALTSSSGCSPHITCRDLHLQPFTMLIVLLAFSLNIYIRD